LNEQFSARMGLRHDTRFVKSEFFYCLLSHRN
jgi:hypothetical protein